MRPIPAIGIRSRPRATNQKNEASRRRDAKRPARKSELQFSVRREANFAPDFFRIRIIPPFVPSGTKGLRAAGAHLSFCMRLKAGPLVHEAPCCEKMASSPRPSPPEDPEEERAGERR